MALTDLAGKGRISIQRQYAEKRLKNTWKYFTSVLTLIFQTILWRTVVLITRKRRNLTLKTGERDFSRSVDNRQDRRKVSPSLKKHPKLRLRVYPCRNLSLLNYRTITKGCRCFLLRMNETNCRHLSGLLPWKLKARSSHTVKRAQGFRIRHQLAD